MAEEFRLPDLGENIESGDVVSVLVSEGDEIAAGQNVIEIETDKATVEVPCPLAGKVTKIHVKPGDTVPVHGLILEIEAVPGGRTATEKAPAKPAPPKPEGRPEPAARPTIEEVEAEAVTAEEAEALGNGRQPPAERRQGVVNPAIQRASAGPPPGRSPTPSRSTTPAPEAPTPAVGSRVGEEEPQANLVPPVPAGPSTRRLARELGVDLRMVVGTGPDGRITREDVIRAVREATTAPARPRPGKRPGVPVAAVEDRDAYGRIRREKMTKIRKTIANNMARSASTIPHVTNFDDADITELDEIRRESIADYVGANIKLTMMPFVMKAVAHALKLHPMLNAMVDLENEEIVYKDYVNLGIAVDTERGLVVPVIRDVDQMGIPQIAQALQRATERTRNNQFSLEDLRGGTFTISNLGAIGGVYSTPIINWPEVAVLLVGRSRKMAIVVDDAIKVRLMMPLSLSYDHRLIDGATAARFLNEVISFLANPGRLLLAPVVS
jgi:pyruvate dehydrogenase E2 component (dihydrolipoamide acetyltransferase)